MKMLFVANEGLAASLKKSLNEYFTVDEITAIDFCHPDHKQAANVLANELQQALSRNPAETFLILADTFGSTAYIETCLLLEKSGLKDRSLILTGMNLPLAIKCYGLKDSLPFATLTSLLSDSAESLETAC